MIDQSDNTNLVLNLYIYFAFEQTNAVKCASERMTEQTNERTNERTGKQTNEWRNESIRTKWRKHVIT